MTDDGPGGAHLALDDRFKVRIWALEQVPKPGHERATLRDHIIAYFHATAGIEKMLFDYGAAHPQRTAVDAAALAVWEGARKMTLVELDALLYRVLRAEDHAFRRRRGA